MKLEFSTEKALIFRITHINNVPWILENGLHCSNSEQLDPSFESIGNPELITKRRTRAVTIPPHGSLSNYISFYFTPFSMMMYNIVTGWAGIRQRSNSEIVIMTTSLQELAKNGIAVVYTDRHAYLQTARFFSSMNDLDNLAWELWEARDFKRDFDNPEKTDRYQAEALIHKHLPIEFLSCIACSNEDTARTLQGMKKLAGVELEIVTQPDWYFKCCR